MSNITDILQSISILPPKPTEQTVRSHARRFNCLPVDELTALAQKILVSPYLATSQLSESFASTQGFSIIFRKEGISQVVEHFPELSTYLNAALKSLCNAFYLNVLILTEGACVTDHIDCSICEYFQELVSPRLVSVLYVQVPQNMKGGQLVLSLNSQEIATIQPQENMLLHFLGHLTHRVQAVQASQPRISIVCEQYNLKEEWLVQVPNFAIKSGAL
ncbi:2OG-Fe(II) oxygenase [Pseudanabaena galeata UHCC 0370]|jgi:hypothetical protein|uniref:2OG-Fe(II) oxygenase n=1 Tax=Pseudanabaena galeata UHCC 0370 TaxID=3110310 RepID=A0ABU5TP61_9CYAN|nr:2OG-Fe(II) oxygenase [Pseudanabaena galeata]MEA5480091.1 2OG-Fe(II) oxygenase [Pseudanabaena galeata UHCC 0370]